MRYKLCLFDFDYTLADTSKPIVESFRYTFSKLNIDNFNEEEAKKTIGMTLDDAFCHMTNIHDNEEFINECVNIYKVKSYEITVKNTVLFEDTIKTLKSIRAKDIKIGIVSSRNGNRIEEILDYLNCLEYIDYIVGVENVSKHKPDPEGLFKAIDYFHQKKEEVLYIGDSYIDAKAAQNAEIAFVGVTTGTTSQNDFEEYNNIRIVSNLYEILDLL